MKFSIKPYAAIAALALGSVIPASAVIVNFNDQDAGTIIDDEYVSQGFTVNVDSNNGLDVGVLYDTNRTDGFDPDLEGGSDGNLFAGGNRDGHAQGNALIIQNKVTSQEITNGELRFDRGTNSGSGGNSPNDSAAGGTITFSFSVDIVEFGFDWVDLDNSESVSLTLTDTITGASASILFSEFTTLGSSVYDSTIQFGDHTANRIQPIGIGDVSWSGGSGAPESFNQVEFTNDGSGAVSRIKFTPVPEVTTALAGFALTSLIFGGLVRRRYHRA